MVSFAVCNIVFHQFYLHFLHDEIFLLGKSLSINKV